MPSIYKVVLNGAHNDQAVVNVLWYRYGIGLVPDALNFWGAEDIAYQVGQEVWPAMKALLPTSYTLTTIDVYPHNDAFELVYSQPYHLQVNEQGVINPADYNGAAPCAIVRFTLEPVVISVDNLAPPKRGYIAFGPLRDSYITNTGHVNISETGDLFPDLAAALSSNLENAEPPALYYPIRAGTRKVLGIITLKGWADVSGATIRPLASFRRSRQAEV